MTYQELKIEKETRFNNLVKESKMFFAFSNEQFAENKCELEPGDKYVSIGAGGYMPKSKVEFYLNGSKEINKWFNKAVKEHKEKHILYELSNHECWYAGSVEGSLPALSNYSRKTVQAVFNKYYSQYIADL